MANCDCNISAGFPFLGGLGIISASLRTNKNIILTEGGVLLFGPTLGDLSITAYAPLPISTFISCPGRAGVSYEWDQRLDCDSYSYVKPIFIPRGKDKAYTEGDVPAGQISMIKYNDYTTFEASAASGPFTVYFKNDHSDGYNFYYSGVPLSVTPNSGKQSTVVSFLSGILPGGSDLYLTNFSWEYNPPNIPTVSYSFIFSYFG
jgi:hypothetical protein